MSENLDLFQYGEEKDAMDISMAAWASIIALLILVGISCVNEDLNVGILGIGFAIIVGSLFAQDIIAASDGAIKTLTGATIMRFFPVNLFMILAGVTFMFGIASTNGTMEKVTAYSVRVCKGNNALIPLVVYVLTMVLTTIGPGNIAATALLAPVMMAIAARVGMSAFLMTLLVVGASNGAAFSPFAPTGIVANGLIERMAPQIGLAPESLSGLAWKIHFNSILAQGVVNIGGFMVLGGWAWIAAQRGKVLDIDELAPKPEPFNQKQVITLVAVALLIILVILPGLPGMKQALPGWLLSMTANVGSVAFMLSSIMLLLSAGDSKAAIKAMPWPVIMMVCGVTVLIEVMDAAGGLNALVQIIGTVSGPETVNFWLGLIPGAISAYSSSSGVVMPMFLPMVPGLIEEIGGGDPIAMISSINVGSHLVDTSPLSTLGALCIASAGDHEDKGKLFRNLLIWGLSMAVVSGIVCYLLFGILGF
jgi:Di- and tricarboxylate transporters